MPIFSPLGSHCWFQWLHDLSAAFMCDDRGDGAGNRRCLPLHRKETARVRTPSMKKSMTAVLFRNAYRLACLGETSGTWDALGHACIEQGEYNLAKKCFSRIRDVKYLNLLAHYEVTGVVERDAEGRMCSLSRNRRSVVKPSRRSI